ncbi:MAG: aminoglycoside phosphotransferase family protein, partial [Bacteroidales bacterium]
MSNLTNEIFIHVENQIKKFLGSTFKGIIPIPLSGSNRFYFRVLLDSKTIIATYNEDIAENEAFFYLQDFFYRLSLPVPHLIHIFEDKKLYLQEDLGDTTLYQYLIEERKKNGSLGQNIAQLYKKVIDDLIQFQLSAKNGLDFSRCYPVEVFDKQAIQWDLNYFKYMFLKLVHVPFNERKLEEEFQYLLQKTNETESNFFMFRDFQSRNIMIKNDKLYYIDFQGGRRGSVYYDIASLLFDAKAELPFALRETLIDFYLEKIKFHLNIEQEKRIRHFNIFV